MDIRCPVPLQVAYETSLCQEKTQISFDCFSSPGGMRDKIIPEDKID